jgi:hypothetical protein
MDGLTGHNSPAQPEGSATAGCVFFNVRKAQGYGPHSIHVHNCFRHIGYVLVTKRPRSATGHRPISTRARRSCSSTALPHPRQSTLANPDRCNGLLRGIEFIAEAVGLFRVHRVWRSDSPRERQLPLARRKRFPASSNSGETTRACSNLSEKPPQRHISEVLGRSPDYEVLRERIDHPSIDPASQRR